MKCLVVEHTNLQTCYYGIMVVLLSNQLSIPVQKIKYLLLYKIEQRLHHRLNMVYIHIRGVGDYDLAKRKLSVCTRQKCRICPVRYANQNYVSDNIIYLHIMFILLIVGIKQLVILAMNRHEKSGDLREPGQRIFSRKQYIPILYMKLERHDQNVGTYIESNAFFGKKICTFMLHIGINFL